jgi:hypothetical protein
MNQELRLSVTSFPNDKDKEAEPPITTKRAPSDTIPSKIPVGHESLARAGRYTASASSRASHI